MTVLTACSDASKLMGFGAMSAVFTSADPFAAELSAIANEAAQDIGKAHDWHKLLVLNAQAGDGSATAFDLPSDYDRMPVKAAVFLTSTTRPMTRIDDLDVWMDHRLQSLGDPLGEWMLLGGQINIYPAMPSGVSAKFYYISNQVAADSGGTAKAAFTADSDVFRLPERLLKLALIWRWRQMKGYDYAEDLQSYEVALAREIKNDKGSRIVAVGQARISGDVATAFPGNIVVA